MKSYLSTVLSFYSRLKGGIYKKLVIQRIFDGVPRDGRILEIGGGYNPRFPKDEYKYAKHLDHADRNELVKKYENDIYAGSLINRIQEIDYVVDSRSMSEVIGEAACFDLIYSSHALEHIIDLVEHLRDLSKYLEANGSIILELPYLRACFDAFRFPTTTADVLFQHYYGKSVHSGRNVFDAFGNGINHFEPRELSRVDRNSLAFLYPLQNSLSRMHESMKMGCKYHDMHSWTFSPESFYLMMVELVLLDKVDLYPVYVSKIYGHTFLVKLKRIEANMNYASLNKIRMDLCFRIFVDRKY